MRGDRKSGDTFINHAVCEVASSSGFTVTPLEERSLQGCLSQFKECAEAHPNPQFPGSEPKERRFSA